MSTKFRHQIQMKDVSWPLEINGNFISEKFILLSERTFSNSFTKSAYKWFDEVVKKNYPDANKVKDTTIVCYHWEFNTKYFELH
jgi:uncharacterized protein YxjI